MAPSTIRTLIALSLLSVIFFLSAVPSLAQERCGTVEYTKKLRKEKKLTEDDAVFEKWLKQKTAFRKQSLQADRTQTTYQIPVVVHVIHNGEPYGSGTNISDAQVFSQIDVLNKDFQRHNADATLTPAEFASVSGSMDIEFVLAKQDPNGLESNGIDRVKGSQSSWTSGDNDLIKSQSYWPSENYMNVWVCNLTDYLGYTQFPVSSLPGLEGSPNVAQTDGIVVFYRSFGSTDDGNFNLLSRYAKGRTLTHEMGHFFGLRHIWGDDNDAADKCSGTDYIDDTPNQTTQTTNCPTGTKTTSCTTSHTMYQNYLDYTDDLCMNLFTKDQVDRMITVLLNSVRRTSLLTSPGLSEPVPVPNDLAITSIISPKVSECASTVIPSIEVTNSGTNTITQTRIQLKINSVTAETKNFALNISPDQTATLNFAAQVLNLGDSKFTFSILQTNTGTDGKSFNDTLSTQVSFNAPIPVPFTETFDLLPDNWVTHNPDHKITWAIDTAPSAKLNNSAIYLDYFDYDNSTGASDMLFSPIFDLSAETVAFLTFDVAYARLDLNSKDSLKVVVLTDCSDLGEGITVYAKSGDTLATAANTTQSFKPNGQGQWRTEVINLSSFIGKSKVQLVFIGTNEAGNNLYLDNVGIITDTFDDLSLSKINNPTLISCETPSPRLLVQNSGTKKITSFDINYTINSENPTTIPFANMNIAPGNDQEITLPEVTLGTGTNVVNFTIGNPNNGEVDINSSNNSKSVLTTVNTSKSLAPIRENFDVTFEDQWSIINPANGDDWKTISTNYNSSLYFDAFTNATIGDESWLISPLLDFSHTEKASVFFDHSYALPNSVTTEKLMILGAVGCGNPFDLVFYDSSGMTLSNTTTSSGSWKPSEAKDWEREFVNLSALAGKKDVRVAFVVTNGHGNNLYIDNIEFFNSDDSVYREIDNPFFVYYNPGGTADFYVRFNLPTQQNVGIEIIDTMGRSLLSDMFVNVLNQTYPITLDSPIASGVYIVKFRTSQQYQTSRVFVGNK